MGDVITTLFQQDVAAAVHNSIHSKKPLFVYVTTGSDNMVQKFLSETANLALKTLAASFICLKITQDLPEYTQFREVVPSVVSPSFTIVEGGKIQGYATETMQMPEFAALVHKYAGVLPKDGQTLVQKHMSEYSRIKHEEAMERQRIRELIAADRRETQSAAIYRKELATKPAHCSLPKNGTCVLSIRLLGGELVKGEFAGDQTLMDVKRWIEHDQHVHLSSDDSSMHGMMAKPGFPVPTRISFYSPGSRITYSEPQELCRLADLDLFPRLALILKPEYDEEVQAIPDKSTLWHQASTKVSTILLAVYSFFDYGVDEAQKDFHALTVSDEKGEQPIAHFVPVVLESTKPVPVSRQTDESETEEVPEPEMDFSLVGLTRKGTPAPSGTSRIHLEKED